MVGYNDLLTANPQLANEWHPEKNGDLKPTDVTKGSNKRVWWLCSVCGHEWNIPVKNRNKGSGCPKCARKRSKC
ncbi:zinc-ribbon domain-containing protein [Peribacillus sp. RS7]|uniref:zinc-ribbon domain-containing protein n=1 Tax=Peribacillus sp. RS7 TaxID=3242679 RepID=UPI0035BEDE1C